MNWRNVRLVWGRELRDQFRDRRSLFMVVVLPVLLYPLLGASAMQLSGFMQQKASKVLVIGSESLAEIEPPLFEENRFAAALTRDRGDADELTIDFKPSTGTDNNQLLVARDALERGDFDVVVYFPPAFATQLKSQREPSAGTGSRAPPQPVIYSNSVRDQSVVARLRIDQFLDAWYAQIVQGNLAARDVPESVTRPFRVEFEDVASDSSRKAALWSRLLPFVVFIWALTGAFYPAVDLCAGEKEGGTLEALLTCPALRSEIVSGKLLTVITFSIASAVANMVSMGLTGSILVSQMNMLPGAENAPLDAPPLMAAVWLVLALIPMAALFSALSLAVAAYARSTKEGQYYLMPLLLVSLPLMLLPLARGVELNVGTALLPISGMVLLLRSAIEGQWATALPYIPIVLGVTAICCWLAIRWAIMQFNRESVLFRDSESFSLGLWLRKLYVDRPAVPSGGLAMACIAAIYFAQFMSRLFAGDFTPERFVPLVLISQACIVGPALLFAIFLVRSPVLALRLTAPARWWQIPGAVLLALLLHPLGLQMGVWIQQLYPLPDAILKSLEGLGGVSLGTALITMALLPAVCEELAFRGFVLTGLKRDIGPWAAAGVSAAAFGFAHGIFQQSISATLLGLLLAALSIRTGSLWPGIAFHAIYNGLQLTKSVADPWLEWFGGDWILGQEVLGMRLYSPWFTAATAVFAVILTLLLCRPAVRSAPQELLASE